MNTVRKNITLPASTYEIINNYAKKCGMSFSEFLRETALKTISINENLSLLEYINANSSYMDNEEQKEIESLKINFDDIDGKGITLDELLQG